MGTRRFGETIATCSRRQFESLGVERLFVVQLHAKDSRVPFEETLAALGNLQREGKIEHVGLCNVSPAEIRQAQRHFEVKLVQCE